MSREEVTDLYDKLNDIHIALTAHTAREEQWRIGLEEKLDEHLDEHKASNERWSRGLVGLVFSVIGAGLIASWEFLRGK